MYVNVQTNLEQMGWGLLTVGTRERLPGAVRPGPFVGVMCLAGMCMCMYVEQRSDMSAFTLQCAEPAEGAEGGRFQEAGCRQSWTFAGGASAQKHRGGIAAAIPVPCRHSLSPSFTCIFFLTLPTYFKPNAPLLSQYSRLHRDTFSLSLVLFLFFIHSPVFHRSTFFVITYWLASRKQLLLKPNRTLILRRFPIQFWGVGFGFHNVAQLPVSPQ